MRVSKLVAPNQIEVFEEPFNQVPESHQVVVRVKAVGICGTDLHVFRGERADVALPRVMGHELSGVVEQVGADVVRLKPGDHVVFDPVVSCGTCKTCLSGHQNVCGDVRCFGVQMDGGFQDYITVDENRLYQYPTGISFEQAALAEPFSIAANILSRSHACAEDSIVIIGAGTIGLAILQAAKGLGCRVLVSDVQEKKLDFAQKFGADRIVNSKSQNLYEQVEIFSPGGADIIIDAVGIAPLTELAIDLAAPEARVVVIGFDGTPAKIPPVKITKKELTLIGSRMNCNQFPKVIEWMEKGSIHTDLMVSRTYPVEQIQQAFEDTLKNGDSIIKTIITF